MSFWQVIFRFQCYTTMPGSWHYHQLSQLGNLMGLALHSLDQRQGWGCCSDSLFWRASKDDMTSFERWHGSKGLRLFIFWSLIDLKAKENRTLKPHCSINVTVTISSPKLQTWAVIIVAWECKEQFSTGAILCLCNLSLILRSFEFWLFLIQLTIALN